MTIEQILKKYSTDKCHEHHYGDAYNTILGRFDRQAKLHILEIGTYKGESLLAWRECFPNSKITGIDVVDYVKKKDMTIKYVVKDIKRWHRKEKFDIIIDDGSHFLGDVIYTVSTFIVNLKAGGVMVIEDVQDPDVWYLAIVDILQNLKYVYSEFRNYEGKIGVSSIDLRASGRADDYLIIITKT